MAYSMAKTDTYIRKIFGLRLLKIDPGRYLAINEEGEYVISTKSQPIRGRPCGEVLRTPLVLGGAPPPPGNPKYRVFVIDAGETFDFVVAGTLAVHDSWIWVAGDTIRHEDEECKNSKFVGYLPLMVSKLLVSKFPKENPQKMSANQIRVEVKKQTFNKMFADIGIEAPKTDNDNAQVRFVKMFADIAMEQIFSKLFAEIGIDLPPGAEVTTEESGIVDEVKSPQAQDKELEEWKANWEATEAFFYWRMHDKDSASDEEKARKEDEKLDAMDPHVDWVQTRLEFDKEELIECKEARADCIQNRAKVEGISANMSVDNRKRGGVSEEAPDNKYDRLF